MRSNPPLTCMTYTSTLQLQPEKPIQGVVVDSRFPMGEGFARDKHRVVDNRSNWQQSGFWHVFIPGFPNVSMSPSSAHDD